MCAKISPHQTSLIYQPSSASGRGRQGPAVWPSPWKDPAGRRSPSTTAKTDPAASRTSPRSPVEQTRTHTQLSPTYVCLLAFTFWVTFSPRSSPGDYEISVKFNDQHIPNSPYLVPAVAPANDARRLTVTGLQVRHEETPAHLALPCFRAPGAQLHKSATSGRKDQKLLL